MYYFKNTVMTPIINIFVETGALQNLSTAFLAAALSANLLF